MKNKELNFYGSLKLLEACEEAGVLQTSPDDPNDFLVYREAGNPPEENPEGWYAVNAHTLAQELMNEPDGQKALLDALKEKGVEFKIQPSYHKGYSFQKEGFEHE